MSGLTPDFADFYRGMMLEGFSREAETTAKVLAAVPDAKKDYRPDPNARSAWELAWHLANTDVQFLNGIAGMKFSMENPAKKPSTVSELVAWYRENVKAGSERVQALKPEQLVTPVQFMMFNFPVVYYLGFLNNHSIHHRGELATYLRPMGSKVPAIYGGSFDEPMQQAA
jgi:uncharacterized damage-inducible protein DinB